MFTEQINSEQLIKWFLSLNILFCLYSPSDLTQSGVFCLIRISCSLIFSTPSSPPPPFSSQENGKRVIYIWHIHTFGNNRILTKCFIQRQGLSHCLYECFVRGITYLQTWTNVMKFIKLLVCMSAWYFFFHIVNDC